MGEALKCATCGNTNLPNPHPELMSRRLVTVYVFCNNECLTEFQQVVVDDACKKVRDRAAIRYLDAAAYDLSAAFDSLPINSQEESDVREIQKELDKLRQKIRERH